MKKNSFIAVIFMVLTCFNVYALDTTLLDMRNKIFKAADEMKPLLANPKDAVIVNNLWDTCIMTVTQLDAYFFMLGIFNTIKKDNPAVAADYLIRWLERIKNTNELNIKNLNITTVELQAVTKSQIRKLTQYFTDLNARLDSDLGKIRLFKKVQ